MGGITDSVSADTSRGVEDTPTHKDDELIQSPRGDGYDAVVAAIIDSKYIQRRPVVVLKVMADLDCIAVCLDDVPIAVVNGVAAFRVIGVRVRVRNINCRASVPAQGGLIESTQDVHIADACCLIQFNLILGGNEVGGVIGGSPSACRTGCRNRISEGIRSYGSNRNHAAVAYNRCVDIQFSASKQAVGSLGNRNSRPSAGVGSAADKTGEVDLERGSLSVGVECVQAISHAHDNKFRTCRGRVGTSPIDGLTHQCASRKPFSTLTDSGNATIHTNVLSLGDEVLTQIDRVVPRVQSDEPLVSIDCVLPCRHYLPVIECQTAFSFSE